MFDAQFTKLAQELFFTKYQFSIRDFVQTDLFDEYIEAYF
jgi:hypothetical protein